jgi:hypothetical protein
MTGAPNAISAELRYGLPTVVSVAGQATWQSLLEEAIRSGNDDWLARAIVHRGCMRWRNINREQVALGAALPQWGANHPDRQVAVLHLERHEPCMILEPAVVSNLIRTEQQGDTRLTALA